MRLINAEPIERALFKQADKSLAKNLYEKARICAFRQAFELILKAPTITPPPNDPLPLEELREMDGEPVWLWKPKRKAIASICIFNGFMLNPLLLSYDFIEDSVNLKTYQYLIERGYKLYRRKPEEVEKC